MRLVWPYQPGGVTVRTPHRVRSRLAASLIDDRNWSRRLFGWQVVFWESTRNRSGLACVCEEIDRRPRCSKCQNRFEPLRQHTLRAAHRQGSEEFSSCHAAFILAFVHSWRSFQDWVRVHLTAVRFGSRSCRCAQSMDLGHWTLDPNSDFGPWTLDSGSSAAGKYPPTLLAAPAGAPAGTLLVLPSEWVTQCYPPAENPESSQLSTRVQQNLPGEV